MSYPPLEQAIPLKAFKKRNPRCLGPLEGMRGENVNGFSLSCSAVHLSKPYHAWQRCRRPSSIWKVCKALLSSRQG